MAKSHRLFLKIFLIIPAIMIGHMAFCWGLMGHRVIGEIAEQHLSKKAKREIAKLFGKETLAWWSNWGDFIKSDSTYDSLYSWHFINLSGTYSKDEFVAKIKSIPVKNLYGQIQAMQAELKDESLPIGKRQQALKLLVHFMGDLA